MTKKKKNPNTLEKLGYVENRVRELMRKGVTIQVILDDIQRYGGAPKSTDSLYRYYGEAIAEERAKLQGEIGEAVMSGVREGNPKLIEFAARARANWNPSVKVEEQDPDSADENSDAISRLADLLGKNKK